MRRRKPRSTKVHAYDHLLILTNDKSRQLISILLLDGVIRMPTGNRRYFILLCAVSVLACECINSRGSVMRVFIAAVVCAAAIGVGAAYVLQMQQETVDVAFSSSSARVGDPGNNLVGMDKG